MQYEIISYLPIKSILAARCVSSYWKNMISRNFTDFICQISDESYPFVANATETFSTVKIFDLSHKEKNVVSSTRGVGRIISNTQKLAFIGDNIDVNEVKKILRYCVYIEELLFQRCSIPILVTTLGLALSKHHFQNLSKLMVFKIYSRFYWSLEGKSIYIYFSNSFSSKGFQTLSRQIFSKVLQL